MSEFGGSSTCYKNEVEAINPLLSCEDRAKDIRIFGGQMSRTGPNVRINYFPILYMYDNMHPTH